MCTVRAAAIGPVRDTTSDRLIVEFRRGLVTREQLRAFADGNADHPAAVALRSLGSPVTFPFQLGATKLLIAAVVRGDEVDWASAKCLETHRMLDSSEYLSLARRTDRLREMHGLAMMFSR